MFQIGTTSASTLTFGLSNSAGMLAIVAAPTGNTTLSLPNGGTLLSNVNISAGTTSNNLSAVTFSNSNGMSFGLNGSVITASNAINVSAGTTSNNLSAVTFSNSNGVSFGLNGSVVTASISPSAGGGIAAAAGTQTATSGTIVFSNSNGITFGMSNSSVITASFNNPANINIAAGTQTAASGTIVLSNSNGLSFGMSNSSVITAQLGGMSSHAEGYVISSFASSHGFLSLQPFVLPYNLTVTQLLWLAHLSGVNTTASSSGAWTISAGIYAISGGTAGSITLLSSASTQQSYNTAGAQYNSLSGTQYRSMTFASWNFTPGPYVMAFYGFSSNGGSHTFWGNRSNVSIVSGIASLLTNQVLPGISASSFSTAMPVSIAITNTASWVRASSNVKNQPWFMMLGT